MAVKNLSFENFNKFLESKNSIVDFYADWCGPCKILSPIIEEVSAKNNDVQFGKVNVDKETDLAQRFQIMSIPTIIFFKDNEQVDRFTGVLSKEELVKKIKDNLK